MKIALISVFPPYRGGIATHSYILYENLIKQNHDVMVVNYLKQYPSFLFPGKNQFDINDLDVKNQSLRLINTMSPKTWKQTSETIIDYNPDVVIFRFWNPFFAISLGLIAKYLKKKNFSKPLLSICDNIIPHENFLGSSLLTKFYLKYIDGFVVQSETVKNELESLKKDAKIVKRFHPIYDIYGDRKNKTESKKQLGIKSKHVILFFGIIREYKGLDVLIESINILKNKLDDFHLLIVGECYENINKYLSLINQFELNHLVTFINEYVSEKDISKYFSCSDVVVLPYKSASQSGVIQIAYNFNTPVVTTDVGGLSEYIDDGNTGVLVESKNPIQLSEVLYDNLVNDCFNQFSKNIEDYKKKFSWEYFIEGIDEIMSEI